MSDDQKDTEDAWEDYETGPFCRHYGDPADCALVCAACGHECWQHPQVERETDYRAGCTECSCSCLGWKENVLDDG